MKELSCLKILTVFGSFQEFNQAAYNSIWQYGGQQIYTQPFTISAVVRA